MMHEDKTCCTAIEETAFEVAPAKARNESGGNESYGQEHLDVPTMLELDDRVARKVAHVGNTGLPAGLDDHPADV